MEIHRCTESDVHEVLAAGHLFDHPPRRDWTVDFLTRQGHHLLLASLDRVTVGFATGIEMCHPDKGVELCLYELGVDEAFRRRGVGRALTEAMADLARDRGCATMWLVSEPDNAAALATYTRAGGTRGADLSVVWEWALRPGTAG